MKGARGVHVHGVGGGQTYTGWSSGTPATGVRLKNSSDMAAPSHPAVFRLSPL